MMLLLEVKEKIKEFYYRSKVYTDVLWKFITAVAIFLIINSQLGYNDKLSSIPVALVLALISAFTGTGVFVFLTGALTIGQVFTTSEVLALIIALLYMIMYCLVLRFTTNFSYLLVLTPILFVLKIPYCIPIVMGIISTPIALLPVSCGVIVYYVFLAIQKTANATFGVSMEDALNIYKIVVSDVFANKELLINLVVFAVALLVTYIIRRQTFNHAFEMGIMAGAVSIVVGSLIGSLIFDAGNILAVILGTVASAAITTIIWFFRSGLDYSAVERIQFEDDDYYYYVKAVPKISVTVPEKNVKRINEPKTSETVSEAEIEEN